MYGIVLFEYNFYIVNKDRGKSGREIKANLHTFWRMIDKTNMYPSIIMFNSQ